MPLNTKPTIAKQIIATIVLTYFVADINFYSQALNTIIHVDIQTRYIYYQWFVENLAFVICFCWPISTPSTMYTNATFSINK